MVSDPAVGQNIVAHDGNSGTTLFATTFALPSPVACRSQRVLMVLFWRHDKSDKGLSFKPALVVVCWKPDSMIHLEAEAKHAQEFF